MGMDPRGAGDPVRSGPVRVHPRQSRSRWAFAALLAALTLVASACSSGPPETSEAANLVAEVSDFKIALDHPSIAAGHVVIGIRNRASMAHELKVIRTDLAPDQLPVGGDAKASEEGKVGEVLNIASGVTRKLVVELPAGKYVLICNVAGHYQLGMRVGLEVK